MSINSTKQNINEVFGNTKYYIDFYQRDYKWKREHVKSLLDDIFFRFENEYRADIDVSTEIIEKYDWYYLNSYVVNDFDGKTYIVDGQQRFTTLTLILIKLFHMAQAHGLKEREDWVKDKLYGTGAEGKSFWMGQNGREKALRYLLDGQAVLSEVADQDITTKNISDNYSYLKQYLEDSLVTRHKLDAFVVFFLQKVMLVKIHIDDSRDVPMVFEVINDRGERLRPYEVFKGELLGQLSKDEIDTYYDFWSSTVRNLQDIGDGSDGQVDDFFKTYFRAKHVDKPAEYREFDGEYHRTVFSSKWNEVFRLKNNPQAVKDFISEEFSYYGRLYAKLIAETREDSRLSEHLFYNGLNEQDRQYLLVLSACQKNDPQEDQKIKAVTRLFDRHYTLLRLMGSYDSNRFSETIYSLNREIRNKSLQEIESSFQALLISDMNEAQGLAANDPYQWSLFKETNNNLGVRFLRYFFARIEHFIAHEAQMPCETYQNLVRNTGSVNGYHVEHIVSDNPDNRALFADEETFHRERNRLGGLLLLKGKDNQSSGNEPYLKKLATYSSSNIWNRTLIDSFYHTNKDFENFVKRFELGFKPYPTVYDEHAVEERQRLLFELARIIWK